VSGAALSMAYFEGIWIIVALLSRIRMTVREAIAAPVSAKMPVATRGEAVDIPAYARAR
jgi:hypothetical protein